MTRLGAGWEQGGRVRGHSGVRGMLPMTTAPFSPTRQGLQQQPALLPQVPSGPHAAPGIVLRGCQCGVGSLPE